MKRFETKEEFLAWVQNPATRLFALQVFSNFLTLIEKDSSFLNKEDKEYCTWYLEFLETTQSEHFKAQRAELVTRLKVAVF